MKILSSNSLSMRRLVQVASSIFAILVVVNIHYLVAQHKIASANNSATQMKVDDVDITCTISAEKTEYVVGEMPVISVLLHNNEDRKVTLVGSLDGSDAGRFPRCQFKIAAPPGHSQPGYGRCGNTNAIRMENFADVPAGGKFDPFARRFGFSSSPTLRWQNFATPGRYKFTFRYSTVGWTKVEDHGLVLGKPEAAATERLKDIPRFAAESNTIELTFTPPPGGFVYGTQVPISRASDRGTNFVSALFSKVEFKASKLDVVWILGCSVNVAAPDDGLYHELAEFDRSLCWHAPKVGSDNCLWMQHMITPNRDWTSEVTTHAAWQVLTMDASDRRSLDEVVGKELGRRELLSGLRQTIAAFKVDAADAKRKVVIFVVTDEPLLPVDVSPHVPVGSVSPIVFRVAVKNGSWIPYPVVAPALD